MLFRLAVLLLTAAWGRTGPALLENASAIVRLGSSASVAEMALKRSLRAPFLEGRGAGLAADGDLFAPLIEAGGAPAVLPHLAVRLTGPGEAAAEASLPGLQFSRVFRLEGTLLSVRDAVRNTSGKALRVRLGGRSVVSRASWSLTSRSWTGAASNRTALHRNAAASRGQGGIVWRYAGQYGTGFIASVSTQGEVEGREEPLEDAGWTRFEWHGAAVELAPGAALAADTAVFLLEGGAGRRETSARDLFVEADLAAAGRTGAPVRGFARVASAGQSAVEVSVAVAGAPGKPILTQRLNLEPGRETAIPFRVVPERKGMLEIRVSVRGGGQRALAEARAQAAIEHPGKAWDLYTRRMPEEIFRGSWEDIGAQLATPERVIGPPTTPRITRRAAAEPGQFASIERRFPYYAGILRGAARKLGAQPAELAMAERAAAAAEGCMDVAILGPDGPINAYSKERSGTGLQGLGYQKVVPSNGYAFHTYMGWGVNSEGLSTSAATLNEDEATRREGERRMAAWRASGKPVIPGAAAKWLILALARDVDEAIALIENPDAPFDLTSNMLLLDRRGNAARVASSGLLRHIGRGPPDSRFFVVGNYPHRGPGGLFGIGTNWGWAANTMLREAMLERTYGGRAASLSIEDAFTLMQTHGAGGMCQHLHDNPGRLYSSCASIAVTRTRELWLAHGPPCEVEYVRYRLED